MTQTATRPDLYFFLSWQELRKRTLVAEPGDLLAALRRLSDGKVPDDLVTEDQVKAFANRTSIPLAEIEFEPGIIFEHSHYASRAWVRAEYQKFLEWCLETGWLDGETVERTAWPVAGPTEPEPVASEPILTADDRFDAAASEWKAFMESSGLAAALARAGQGEVAVADEPAPEPEPEVKNRRRGKAPA